MTAPEPPVTYQNQPPPEFSYEEYLAATAAILAALAALVGSIAVPFQAMQLTRRDWLSFLAAVYPLVENSRREIAKLARRFYDSERAKHVGPIEIPILDTAPVIGPDGRPIRLEDEVGVTQRVWPRLNIDLAPYKPEWFEEAMDAAVEDFSRRNATDGALARTIGITLKEAENGGRRTTLWAVDDDPEVLGWARVEGNENIGSCGFCAMLISRGPVYKLDPRNAGLNVDDETLAVEIWRQAEATGDDSVLMGLMTRWHPNCDCKVVPVFDRSSWPGRDKYMAMERLWAQVTKGLSGRDALNAFRRAIERGETGDGLPSVLRPAA